MSRTGKGLLVLVLLAGIAAPSTAAPTRSVTRNYTGSGAVTVSDHPGVFVQDVSTDGENSGESVGGAFFSPIPKRNETRFKVATRDVTGQPVAIRVFWVRPGHSKAGPPRTFCDGETPVLKGDPRGSVLTFLVAGPCDGSASVPTRGEITVTFSRT